MKNTNPKINIYGVGRSGTKAVQVYIAYLFAQQHHSVWLNYEPYYWLSTKGGFSFEGWKYNTTDFQLCAAEDQLSSKHQRFVKKLVSHEGMPVVTKFIRANGRIKQIDDIIQPDYSFVIIRDLYQVLSSLLQMPWDYFRLYTLPLGRRSVWDRLLKDAYQNEILDSKQLDEIASINVDEDRITQAAFYWYAMNIMALRQERENLFFIPYEELNQIERILKGNKMIDETAPSISNSLFKGSGIHSSYPLKDVGINIKRKKYFNLFNELSYYFSNPIFSKYVVPIKFQTGNEVVINPNRNEKIEVIKPFKYKATVQNTALLDFFNEDIKKRINNRNVILDINKTPL